MQRNIKFKTVIFLLGLIFGKHISCQVSATAVARTLDLAKHIHLKNIGNSVATSQASSLTLSQLQTNYSIPSVHVATASVSWGANQATVPAWNLNINNLGKGYAFIADPWNGNIQTEFSAGRGVASVIPASVQRAIIRAFNAGGVSLALLAIDVNGTYISDLTQRAPANMYLYIFDKNGNPIPGTPIPFPAVNYAGSTVTTPAVFQTNSIVMGGLGLSTAQRLTYPFIVTVSNSGVQQQQVEFPTYNLNNNSLRELNFDISTPNSSTIYHVPFITSPWGAVAPLISDLSFIPAGTTQFTIIIYGYDGSNNILHNFTDLQNSINAQTLTGFAAYIYDQNNNALGTAQPVSITLAQQLDAVFRSGVPSVALSVNGGQVTPSATITYPIAVTLQNILGWAPQAPVAAATSAPITLAQMEAALGVTNVSSPVTVSISQVLQSGPLLSFGDDNTMNYNIALNPGQTGFQADISSLIRPSYSFIVVAVDSTNTMMKSLVGPFTNPFKKFMIYIFDENGALVPGAPVALEKAVGSDFSTVYPSGFPVNLSRYEIQVYPSTGTGWGNYPFVVNLVA